MLVAAEELFRLGGPDALTVEGVVERAGTSTGSFYARFGSRHGLFVAMHERFLETFGDALRQAAADALAQPTLRDALGLYFGVTLATVRRHRDMMHFHMIHNAHDVEMRAQGNEVSQGGFALIVSIVENHPARTPATDLDTLDIVARSFFGLVLETVLFEPDEASGRHMSDERRAAVFTDMVLAYLSK